jgi:hypothetical protein
MNLLLYMTNIYLTERIVEFELQIAHSIKQDPNHPIASNPIFNIAATNLVKILQSENIL